MQAKEDQCIDIGSHCKQHHIYIYKEHHDLINNNNIESRSNLDQIDPNPNNQQNKSTMFLQSQLHWSVSWFVTVMIILHALAFGYLLIKVVQNWNATSLKKKE